jgi:hypothetical protein
MLVNAMSNQQQTFMRKRRSPNQQQFVGLANHRRVPASVPDPNALLDALRQQGVPDPAALAVAGVPANGRLVCAVVSKPADGEPAAGQSPRQYCLSDKLDVVPGTVTRTGMASVSGA